MLEIVVDNGAAHGTGTGGPTSWTSSPFDGRPAKVGALSV